MTLRSPVTDLRGVGEEQAKKFAILGVRTVGDLIDYLIRHEGYDIRVPSN